MLCWMVALVASFAALSWAALMYLADDEQRATVFAGGGLVLIAWSVFHLTDRPQHP